MVAIVALETTPNLTLIAGATQHWRDAPAGAGWHESIARHARGRTLVIGTVAERVLHAVAAKADEVHVLTRDRKSVV